jgi:hypothetical protein
MAYELFAKSTGAGSKKRRLVSSHKRGERSPCTLQAKTTLTGLPVGSTVEFRYRPVVKTGEGDWSQTVTLVIR